MSSHKKLSLLFLSILFLAFALGSFVFAQRQLEVDYPEIGGFKPEVITKDILPKYILYIFNFVVGFAGLIIFAVLLYAGFRYFTSGGNAAAAADAKERIGETIIGLLVIFGSYLILTTINPQLTFLKFPELTKPEIPIATLPFPEEKVLFYTEIPVGGLIADMLSDKRMGSIIQVSETVKEKAENVKKRATELKNLTAGCQCSILDRGACNVGNCQNPSCVSQCACAGDPCPNRKEIRKKQEELGGAVNELKDWRKKLDIEINGSREGDKEKIIGIKKLYEDLGKAEDLIKECPSSSSKQGKIQQILGYSDFWQYREALASLNLVKKVEPEEPWDYIKTDASNPYYATTLYCTEYLYSVLPPEEKIEIPQAEEEFKKTEKEMIALGEQEPSIKIPSTFCGAEIPIGNAVDNAQALVQKIIAELEKINNNVSSEITDGESLILFPDQCSSANCSNYMTTTNNGCCGSCCCGCCPPPPPPEGDGAWNWRPNDNPFFLEKLLTEEDRTTKNFFSDIAENFFLPCVVLAQGGCEYGCCNPCCCYHYCDSCSCTTCAGNACPAQISALENQISDYFNSIEKTFLSLKNLIEERGIEDNLKRSEIIKDLNTSRNAIGACYNSEETQLQYYRGEKVIWRELQDCAYIKELAAGDLPLYNEETRTAITKCYGPESEKDTKLDNYFCCKTELGFEF